VQISLVILQVTELLLASPVRQ